MSEKTHEVTLQLSESTIDVLNRYQQYTGTDPETYLLAMIEKTLPTVTALVESFDEAEGDQVAAMKIYSQKISEMVLETSEED